MYLFFSLISSLKNGVYIPGVNFHSEIASKFTKVQKKKNSNSELNIEF